MKAVFDFEDYKDYLRELMDERGRGERSRVAGALRCHVAYISQVLGAQAQLSLEQADQLSGYLGHSEEEQEFFLLLVSHARAGSASLRRRFELKIRMHRQERASLENRLKKERLLPDQEQSVYYSAWHYSAIHLLITIPGLQTKEAIAQHLRLPATQVARVLEFLVQTGLATLSNGRYQAGQVALHLRNDSPWVHRHHASWRMQTLQALDRPEAQNFHYTSTVSMSEDDLPAIRKILADAIEEVRAVVKKSPEKAPYCFAVDLFGF
jgi:uncharacterized protein (TIGR02147 family)